MDDSKPRNDAVLELKLAQEFNRYKYYEKLHKASATKVAALLEKSRQWFERETPLSAHRAMLYENRAELYKRDADSFFRNKATFHLCRMLGYYNQMSVPPTGYTVKMVEEAQQVIEMIKNPQR